MRSTSRSCQMRKRSKTRQCHSRPLPFAVPTQKCHGAPSSLALIPICCSWRMGSQPGPTGGNIVISRRLVIGLLGAGAVTFALYAAPVLAFSPEARNAKLDETLRGLVEGRSTPGIVVLILQNGRPVYNRSVGVREVGSAALIGEDDM